MYTTIQGEPIDGTIFKTYENTMIVELPDGTKHLCNKPEGVKKEKKYSNNRHYPVSIELMNGEEKRFDSLSEAGRKFNVYKSSIKNWGKREEDFPSKRMVELGIRRIKLMNGDNDDRNRKNK